MGACREGRWTLESRNDAFDSGRKRKMPTACPWEFHDFCYRRTTLRVVNVAAGSSTRRVDRPSRTGSTREPPCGNLPPLLDPRHRRTLPSASFRGRRRRRMPEGSSARATWGSTKREALPGKPRAPLSWSLARLPPKSVVILPASSRDCPLWAGFSPRTTWRGRHFVVDSPAVAWRRRICVE